MGRPNRRFMNVEEEDEDVRVRSRQMICCGDPCREQPNGKEEEDDHICFNISPPQRLIFTLEICKWPITCSF